MNVLPIPAGLREARRFLPWRQVPRPNGKLGKVPQAGVRGVLRPCNPLHSVSWLRIEDALALVRSELADGIGIVLDEELGITAIDLDDCLSVTGELTPRACAVLQTFGAGSYVERSPSKQGLHVLVRGLVPGGWRRQPGVELICSGFLTVTGDVVQHAPDPWPDLTEVLGKWHRERTKLHLAGPSASPSLSVSHEQLLQRARAAGSGRTFRALWDAEPDAAPSASEGDLRLLLMLLYWGGSGMADSDLDVLFRQSARYRPKWDAQHGRQTYGYRTIEAARRIKGQGD